MDNYTKLKNILEELFELDKSELDFGIYRIMNQKRAQVNEFLTQGLPKNIQTILKRDSSLSNEEVNVLEQEIFSHLANFFKRYYKDGDFISLRRYKKDVYAIPYEGEEVKLHWANHDQYYIKTSEDLKNYAFKLKNGKKVSFQLKEATTEQNNNKLQGDGERRFALCASNIWDVSENGNELFINFTYEVHPKAVKQADLIKDAIAKLQTDLPKEFVEIWESLPSDKNANRSILEKHLSNFVSNNTFDYFIHKDLGGFLSRELDFYIKNEIIYLDDIDSTSIDQLAAQLTKVKALKAVAHQIIAFLAQIEDFQKKLWLKKKFVISTNYCITLDRIPSEYYAEIFANKTQLEEWKTMYDVNITQESELVFEPYLVLDTKHFSVDFKDRLLAEFDRLDEETNGILINSENFQALNLIQSKFKDKIQSIYIDPPYNTDSAPIVYKNDYKDSSWLSLIYDRIKLARFLMTEGGFISLAIDYAELFNVGKLLEILYDYIGVVTVVHKPEGRNQEKFYATSNEYMLTYSKNKLKANFTKVLLDDDKKAEYIYSDDKGKYKLNNYLRIGGGDDNLRINKPHFWYPIYVNKATLEVSLEENDNCEAVYPISSNGHERTWKTKKETFEKALKDGEILAIRDGNKYVINEKYRETKGQLIKTHWIDKRYNAINNGTNILNNILGNTIFTFPKSIGVVKDTISFTSCNDSFIIDFFAGSGTTGHATIKLNREDGGKRKFILVEMGTYFNTVTKPRIQKVIYSDNWKNGKPQDKAGISHMFKYQVLESYEDTLNNLKLKTDHYTMFEEGEEQMKEDYLLHYMLDVETRDHLFDLTLFEDPFNYQLKVTEHNELVPTTVDLVETFNYLIGLEVRRIQKIKGRDMKVVEGCTRNGEETLIIWRNTATVSNEEVENIFNRLYDSTRTNEFQVIYVNGDHNLENVKKEQDHFKVKQIEDVFFKEMFNVNEGI